jgi:hypothetical protein
MTASEIRFCRELADLGRVRAKAVGVELVVVGIRDIIPPGEMKELMNKVTEAKKAAEANLIVARQEATAATKPYHGSARLPLAIATICGSLRLFASLYARALSFIPPRASTLHRATSRPAS